MTISAAEWVNLRRIGQSKVVRLTILVPIFGYLILFNEEIVHLFEVSTQVVKGLNTVPVIQEVISNDTKTRLYFFYFGFTFLGIGSLIYQVFCPGLIKDYSSEREFLREEVGLVTKKRFNRMASYLEQENLASPIDVNDAVDEYANATSLMPKQREAQIDAAKMDIMVLFWWSENVSRVVARHAILFFYLVGFCVLAIPSLNMFYRVARALAS